MTEKRIPEYDLHEEQLTHLDLSEFTLVASGASVRDTIGKMRAERHNCAFVTRDGRLVGIFTDRDVLREVVDRPQIWDRPIDEIMTHQPRTIAADQTAGDALHLMNELRFRNVPVIDATGAIKGNLTYFALIRYLADLFPEQVYNLPPKPDRYGSERHGG